MAILTRCMQKVWYSASNHRLCQGLIAFTCIMMFSGCNSSESKVSCVRDQKIFFSFELEDLISIPLVQTTTYDKIPFIEFSLNNEEWKMTALMTESVGELMGELLRGHQKGSTPLIVYTKDSVGDEYVIVVGKENESFMGSLPYLLKESRFQEKKMGSQTYLGLKMSEGGQIPFYLLQQSF